MKHKIFSIFLIIIIFAALTAQIQAFPGDDLKTMMKWSSNHKAITKFTKRDKKQDWYPDYSSKYKKNIDVSIDIWINKQSKVTDEIVESIYKISIYDVLKDIYGKELYEDYLSSKMVAKKDHGGAGYSMLYKGKKYLYSVSASVGGVNKKNVDSVKILHLSDLKEMLKHWNDKGENGF